MEAVQAYFQKSTGRKAQKITSFSSEYKYSSATFEESSYVLGAPEFVLRDDYPAYEEEIEKEASKGYGYWCLETVKRHRTAGRFVGK